MLDSIPFIPVFSQYTEAVPTLTQLAAGFSSATDLASSKQVFSISLGKLERNSSMLFVMSESFIACCLYAFPLATHCKRRDMLIR